jgi:hypothetical protein
VYEYETTADLNEAIYYERLDADMEMAQFEAEARYYATRRAKGICDHNGSALGYKSPAFYSAEDIAGMLSTARHGNRGGFTGDQTAIGAGNMLCTDCGEIQADPFADR